MTTATVENAAGAKSAYATLPEAAKELLAVLQRYSANSAERAMTDADLAQRIGCPVRDVIDHAEALTAIDVAVLATCGKGGGGRFISESADEIEKYAAGLHERAKAIHGRAKSYTDVAARKREAQRVASGGQERLW